MAYELLGAGFPVPNAVIENGAKPATSGQFEQRSEASVQLIVCGLNSDGRLFFELGSVREISRSGCRLHLCTKPQGDSPLAVRMINSKGETIRESAQILFEVTWLMPEAEGWAVGARSLAKADLRTLVFPPQKP
jgi:hypothetical protein